MQFRLSGKAAIVLILAILLSPGISKATDLEKTIEKIVDCGNESKSVTRLLAAVLDKRIKNNDAKEILEPILDICEQGYPVRIYFQKMDEGLGKRIPAPLIISALRKMHQNFKAIHTAISNDAATIDKTIVISATNAANSDVKIDFITSCIEKYKRNSDPKTLTMTFWTAGALARAGLNQSQIERIALAGIESGSIDTSWKYVSRVVSAARSKGIPDSEITATAIRILTENGTLVDFMVALGFSERSIQ
ncbi:hypothetical protein [Maridesulfovibrio sp.]|uniref:hypothetical protein n=1 Tax=unclassified Maridesulfovibrio TaxID=2794999 RepID=UPI003AFF7111